MEKIRLLLVDDHRVLRAGLRALIDRQTDMEVVGEADSTSEALTLVRRLRPDLIILDLTFPGGGGMNLVGQLSAGESPPRVLILTMHDDPAYARAALAAGVGGYVVKTVSEQDLLTALRAVHRGQVFVDLDDQERTASVFGVGGSLGRKTSTGRCVKLSEREQQVLCLLGQGHTNQAIAEQLDLSPKTVATYRARLADKLGLKTTADFVRYATDTALLPGVDSRS